MPAGEVCNAHTHTVGNFFFFKRQFICDVGRERAILPDALRS